MEKHEGVLDVTEPVGTMILSEKSKKTMQLFREAMNSVYYIYDSDLPGF